jgi:hypothetical protein
MATCATPNSPRASSTAASPQLRSAVAAVGTRPTRWMTRPTAGTSSGASARVWSITWPVRWMVISRSPTSRASLPEVVWPARVSRRRRCGRSGRRRLDGAGQLADRLGEQAGVGRVAEVGHHHGGVDADAATCLQSLVAQRIGQILSSFDRTQQLKPNQTLLVRRLPHGTFFSTKYLGGSSTTYLAAARRLISLTGPGRRQTGANQQAGAAKRLASVALRGRANRSPGRTFAS